MHYIAQERAIELEKRYKSKVSLQVDVCCSCSGFVAVIFQHNLWIYYQCVDKLHALIFAYLNFIYTLTVYFTSIGAVYSILLIFLLLWS